MKGFYVKYLLFLLEFNHNWSYLTTFNEKSYIPNFIKIISDLFTSTRTEMYGDV